MSQQNRHKDGWGPLAGAGGDGGHPERQRRWSVLRAAALYSAAVVLILAGAGCGAAAPAGSASPGASTTTAVAGRTQTPVAGATPAATAVASRTQTPAASTTPAATAVAGRTQTPAGAATLPAIAMQPAGVRTNVRDVDLIIDAVLANDIDARRELLAYVVTPCTTAQGMGGPPKCLPGEVNGTPVEVFPFLGEEGEHVRRAAIDRILQFAVEGLYGVYRVPGSAFRAEYWPAGTYGLIFVAKGLQRQATILVTDGKIVRIELSRQERWPGKDTPGIDWLLPPVSSQP
jgi:hypothetical protein